MALYKSLMEETPLSRTKEPGSATDDFTEVLSNTEGYISSSIPWKSSEPVTDNTDSAASTNMLELPYTTFNSSREHENTTCETASSSSLTDPNHFSEIPSSLAPENILSEITTELVCDTRLTETSVRQQPSSEENPSLTCVRSDRLGNHGDTSKQAIGDDGGINIDRYQSGPRGIMHNLDQSVSCFNGQIHHTDSGIDTRGEQSMYRDADKSYCQIHHTDSGIDTRGEQSMYRDADKSYCEIHYTDSDIDTRGEQSMYRDADKSYCQIHHTDSDIDTRGEQSMHRDADKSCCKVSMQNKNTPAYKYSNWKTDEITDRLLSDQSTKSNACSKDNICNKMSPNIERSIKQAITDEGQTREHCLYVSSEVLNTDQSNQLSDQVTTDLVKMITKNGLQYGDHLNKNNPQDDRKERSQALNEQDKIKINSPFHDTADLHIQNMDASQTETLLTKIEPDPNVNTEANPVLAEAMARRDAMVKDLSVDGSGLKVMCCLLGVIVVFAIAIITIVVTGL